MEKLDSTKREVIKKMSNVRLISKLLESGEDEDTVQAMSGLAMSWTELMSAWAEVVAAGKDKPPVTPSPVVYDPEIERQRLDFEMRKYEQEVAERRQEAEERRRREEREAEEHRQEAEERRQRDEREADEREQKDELKRRELEIPVREMELQANRKRYDDEIRLREQELQIQRERDRLSKSLVSRTKLFGDALKGTMAHVEVVHLLTYFKDVEQLFAKFEVPDELKAQLLRPYLNEKAKLLVSRMDPTKASDCRIMLLKRCYCVNSSFHPRYILKSSTQTYVNKKRLV